MNIHGEHIERVTITGDWSEYGNAWQHCTDTGYTVVRYGGRLVDTPEGVDNTQFEIVAECRLFNGMMHNPVGDRVVNP